MDTTSQVFGTLQFSGAAPQRIPGLLMLCQWEKGPQQVGLVIVKTFPGKEGPRVLKVLNGLFETRSMCSEPVTVVVVSPTMWGVMVHPGQKVATVREADVVNPTLRGDPPPINPKWFYFGDSPVAEAWKVRLWKKLQGPSHVFSLHDWDVGEAKGVKHQICLNDPQPFCERSHHIPLAKMGEVRHHLQEL